ncbi:hypothetical protein HK101_001050 [Irineochytrium annulatum]|nr:hypothetical protein HK101_001050 [Irineochytrium annulatum]
MSEMGWNSNRQFGCWNMGLRSSAAGGSDSKTAVATVIQPVYNDAFVGTSNPTLAGNPIFNTLPCQSGYSDAVQIWYVAVDKSVVFNFFKDYATLQAAFGQGTVSGVFNYAIVEPGSTITLNPADVATNPSISSASVPVLSDGWYQDKQIFFYNFGPVATSGSAVSNANVVFPYSSTSGSNVLSGDPIFSAVQGDSAYSGFYAVGKTLATASYTNYTDASATVTDMGEILNCPYAYFTSE